jgi:4-amino-4-deoxy-L-arabinose transferase-like glycosyltransferase
MSVATAPGGRIGRAGVLLSRLGAVVLAAALMAAVVVLGYRLIMQAGDLVAVARDVSAVAVLAGAGGAFVTLVVRVARTRPTLALLTALLAFVGIRAIVILAYDGALTSDWLAHHRLAVGWTLGAPPIANRPMGYPMLLGEVYRVAGAHPAIGEVLALFLATIGAALLAGWVHVLTDRAVAAAAVAILALAPSQALFILLLAIETPYTTALVAVALLVTLVLREATTSRRGRPLAYAVAAGLVLGLSTYLRPTSLLLAPVVVLLPVLLTAWRRSAPLSMTLAISFLVALAPVVATNRMVLDRWSPSTSLYAGWQLYVGTNVDAGGRRTPADVERVDRAVPGYAAGRLPREYSLGIFDPRTLRLSAERDAAALRLAADRIARDWPRLPLVIPFKVVYGWGPGDSPVEWIPDLGRASSVASLAGQVWWVVVLAGACAWYVRARRQDDLPGLIVSAFVLPVAVGLLVLEVQPRYHEYVVPLLVGLAAMSTVPHAAPWRGPEDSGP